MPSYDRMNEARSHVQPTTGRWEDELLRGAACRGAAQRGDDRFTVEPPNHEAPREDWDDYYEVVESAKRVCATCPVTTLCRWMGDLVDEHAMRLAHGKQSPVAYMAGVYGGESVEERLERRGFRNKHSSLELHREGVREDDPDWAGLRYVRAEVESGAA